MDFIQHCCDKFWHLNWSCCIFGSQPFESRRRWFYDNLDTEGSNREIIHSPPNDDDVLVINRGKQISGPCVCREIIHSPPNDDDVLVINRGKQTSGPCVCREIIHSPPNDDDVLVINRGKQISGPLCAVNVHTVMHPLRYRLKKQPQWKNWGMGGGSFRCDYKKWKHCSKA